MSLSAGDRDLGNQSAKGDNDITAQEISRTNSPLDALQPVTDLLEIVDDVVKECSDQPSSQSSGSIVVVVDG